MTRSPQVLGWVMLGVLALFALSLFVPSTVSVAEKAIGSDPRVTDGERTLTSLDLQNVNQERLSGLRENRITVRFETTEVGETIKCEVDQQEASGGWLSVMRYTLDGSAPTASSPQRPLMCPEGEAVLASAHNYFTTLPTATLAAAGVNGVITFDFSVTPATPPGQDPTIDPPAGQARYKYRLDRTEPTLANKVPAPVAGASVTDGVTKIDRPALSFLVTDDSREASLEPTSVNVTVRGKDTALANNPALRADTRHFVCAAINAHNITCGLNYQNLPANFVWPEGNYTVVVKANDTTKNKINTTNGMFGFRIDKKLPNVTLVTAQPNAVASAAPPGGVPTTGRGTNITVSADIRDVNMNTKGTTDVFAQLYNTTLNLNSEFYPMTFVSGNKWESKGVRVPTTWPEGIYALSTRVVAGDLAGNIGTNSTGAIVAGKFAPKDAFIVDAVKPKINETAVPAYVREVAIPVEANITDQGSGLDKSKVKIRFLNLTGNFVAPPTGTTKVQGYHEAPMTNPSGDRFTYQIPAAKDGAIIVYFIVAQDKANVTSIGEAHTIRADGKAPVIREIDAKAFRGPPLNTFRVEVVDQVSGVNQSSVKMLYNFGGSTFKSVTMTRNLNSTFFEGQANFTGATDGGSLRYFFEAKDVAGNAGNLSSAANPLTTKVDLKAPTSSLVAPPTANTERFTVTWNATDVGAGIDVFTFQARLQGDDRWTNVLEGTQLKATDFCAEGNRTYEFRVFAKDLAGNTETPPAAPMGTTRLDGPGCKEVLTIRVLSPAVGARLDGRQNSTNVVYVATSTSSITPSAYLRIAVIFSPDDGAHYYTRAASLNNTGTYALNLKDLPSCRVCLVKVQATSLSGAKGEGTSVPFEILNGNSLVDLDGNALADSWELRYGRALGTFQPDADNDKDGLQNTEESAVGTDPNSKDTDGDGASDRAEVRAGFNPVSALSVPGREFTREDEYTNWYWVVPGLFLGTAVLFFAGLVRRW